MRTQRVSSCQAPRACRVAAGREEAVDEGANIVDPLRRPAADALREAPDASACRHPRSANRGHVSREHGKQIDRRAKLAYRKHERLTSKCYELFLLPPRGWSCHIGPFSAWHSW